MSWTRLNRNWALMLSGTTFWAFAVASKVEEVRPSVSRKVVEQLRHCFRHNLSIFNYEPPDGRRRTRPLGENGIRQTTEAAGSNKHVCYCRTEDTRA
jgi:hypothetical protein